MKKALLIIAAGSALANTILLVSIGKYAAAAIMFVVYVLYMWAKVTLATIK